MIVGILGFWFIFDFLMVNGLGLFFYFGIILIFIVVVVIIVLLFMYVYGKIIFLVLMYVLVGVFLLIGLYVENSMGGGWFICMVACVVVIGVLGFFMSLLFNCYWWEM